MIPSGTCCCFRCGKLFYADQIAFYDSLNNHLWAAHDGSYTAVNRSTGSDVDVSTKKIQVIKSKGVPDQLNVEDTSTNRSLRIHTNVCPFCKQELQDKAGRYPTYTFLMTGLPGVGKTAFGEYTTSQAGQQFVRQLGLSVSSGGKLGGARLEATQVGSSKLFNILVSDGKNTSMINFFDVSGELYSNRRFADNVIEDGFYELRQILANMGNALDGCIAMMDSRNLAPQFQRFAVEFALNDAETAIDEFLQWLKDERKDFPILYVFNKSDQLKGTVTRDNAAITTSSLLFKNAALSKRALATHIALAQKFILNCCCSAATANDPCFVIQLGNPGPDNTLYFNEAKNAALPFVFLLHRFKLCPKNLPD